MRHLGTRGQVKVKVKYLVSSNKISKPERPCLTTFRNTEKRVENTRRSGVFLTNFEVFGNVVKHCLECLIYLLRAELKLWSKLRNTIVKLYANSDQIFKHCTVMVPFV